MYVNIVIIDSWTYKQLNTNKPSEWQNLWKTELFPC